MKPRVTLRQALEDPELLGAALEGPTTEPLAKERPGTNAYFGVTAKGVDKSGKYPPAPITKATTEPLSARRIKSESVATRNFI